MHCCLWFRSVFRVRGPWPKRYGYHLSIIYSRYTNRITQMYRGKVVGKMKKDGTEIKNII